jgi:hypothetical protein
MREGPVPKTFSEAVADVERLTGSKGQRGEAPSGERLHGVVLFETRRNAGFDLVTTHQERLRASGSFLFVYEHGHGFKPDVVGLAPTLDKFDVVRRVQTDAANHAHDTVAVVAWLREIDRDEPFRLVGAGMDFVEGAFEGPVKDRRKLAERIYSFCPDFVDQGIGLSEKGEPHALIERYFVENRAFFFWWD